MYANKIPSLVKMTLIRISLKFIWLWLIKTENSKLRNKATRTTKRRHATAASASAQSAQDGLTCAHERIPEPTTGEKAAENNDSYATERSSYKQKLAWILETHVYCATRTSENLLTDCSLYQGTGENLCLFNKIFSGIWHIIKYIQFFKRCQ